MFNGTLVVRPARYNPEKGLRHADNSDVHNVWSLLGGYAKESLLLPRTEEDIQEKIANFRIAELNGEFVGCVAIRNYGNSLYEVRSFAVVPEHVGQGIGSEILSGVIRQMKEAGTPARLFSLTYRAHFFIRLGFRIVDKSMFPGKIWSDCVICKNKDNCDETAVLMEFP